MLQACDWRSASKRDWRTRATNVIGELERRENRDVRATTLRAFRREGRYQQAPGPTLSMQRQSDDLADVMALLFPAGETSGFSPI